MAEHPLPVFITGASRGIGAATAREFAKRGHPVALVARTAAAIEALAQEIENAGGHAIALPCDVADLEAVKRALDRAAEALGGIGIVINNAGTIEPIDAIADADMAAWAKAIAINLTGPVYLMHHAIPLLPRDGVIINVTSGAAEHAQFGRSAYCASKAGLMIASRICAIEEGERRGIRVIGFSPGLVDTDMNALNRARRMGNAGNINVADLRPPAETARILYWLTTQEAADCAGKIVSAREPELRRRAGVA
ncbi:MAG TPA: SDR family oxidoreductase [Stellaceae bacterium]|nr:SDR family oxidoreductase [Stellaceae bacterium]